MGFRDAPNTRYVTIEAHPLGSPRGGIRGLVSPCFGNQANISQNIGIQPKQDHIYWELLYDAHCANSSRPSAQGEPRLSRPI